MKTRSLNTIVTLLTLGTAALVVAAAASGVSALSHRRPRVSRYTATATDTVGYMGMPATGRSIRTTAMQMFRFKDGLIVESWAVRDDLGTLRQLGHFPDTSSRR